MHKELISSGVCSFG